jgi:5-methylcytosine-specific restriction endonuclease McrA
VKRAGSSKGRQRLAGAAYSELRLAILRRDRWMCQCCGARQCLEVHHQQRRSQLGGDAEENLITLCSACHARTHSHRPRDNDLVSIKTPLRPKLQIRGCAAIHFVR